MNPMQSEPLRGRHPQESLRDALDRVCGDRPCPDHDAAHHTRVFPALNRMGDAEPAEARSARGSSEENLENLNHQEAFS
jgi:hypothetical protein